MGILRSVLSYSWSFGTTWEANPATGGIHDWGPINLIIPSTTGKTGPDDELITYTNYTAAAGALLWDSVDAEEEKARARLQGFEALALLAAATAQVSEVAEIAALVTIVTPAESVDEDAGLVVAEENAAAGVV